MAVKSDPRYALAHARLAEAWAELDSTGEAQQQMLLATAAEQQLSLHDEDKRYIDAVHHTLVREYSAAAQDYEEILKRLPGEEKADGLVDLGRAYEKAGKVNGTMASYEQAAKLNPDEPAPFVHVGIWKSRRRDPAGAEVAFTRAEELYRAKSNDEGLAEVAYQRGYAANEAADSEHAHQYLNLSLNIARQIHSPQLEARSLSQLCSVEYYDGKGDKAIEDANQAIKIADENGLEYWKAERPDASGNAYLYKLDYANAESYAQQALGLARHNQHPRIEADAAFTLASIRDVQGGKWDEQISLAGVALRYYRDFGFMNMAAASSILIVRGEERKGNFAEALQAGTDLLQLAEKTHSDVSVETAEEAVGSAYLALEDYPAALAHFERALEIASKLHNAEAYQEAHCAEVLWRLGRYQDAEEMLARIPQGDRQRGDIGADIAGTSSAAMLLSRGKNLRLSSISRQALHQFPSLPGDTVADFVEVAALAEARLGKLDQARGDADKALALAHKETNEDLVAQAQLVEAEVYWRSHLPAKALAFAQSAAVYFSAKGKKESEWLSLFYLAQAARVSGDVPSEVRDVQKALDILANLEQELVT